jgi:hypothetical protein
MNKKKRSIQKRQACIRIRGLALGLDNILIIFMKHAVQWHIRTIKLQNRGNIHDNKTNCKTNLFFYKFWWWELQEICVKEHWAQT